MSYLAFDTETSGKLNFKKPITDPCQPRVVSMGAVLFDDEGNEVGNYYSLIKPEGFAIPAEATTIHGITTEKALKYGVPFQAAWSPIIHMMALADYVFIFNEQFDRNVMNVEIAIRYNEDSYLQTNQQKIRCLMQVMTSRMMLPGGYGGDYKWPKLSEAYEWLFKAPMTGAHNALTDARATGWLAYGLQETGSWNFEDAT